MAVDSNIETKVIKNFIVKNKQERYLTFISKEKTRGKFLDKLAHFSTELKGFDEIINGKYKEIRERIKPLKNVMDCYIISENRDIDGRRMKIEEALTETIGYPFGTLIVFGNADVVYYEGEGGNDRWINKAKK